MVWGGPGFWASNPLDAQRCLGFSGCPNDPDIFPDLGISDWGSFGILFGGCYYPYLCEPKAAKNHRQNYCNRVSLFGYLQSDGQK